jgi:hypothetical protein
MVSSGADVIAVVDAFAERPSAMLLRALGEGDLFAIKVANLVTAQSCRHVCCQLVGSEISIPHVDVPGMMAVGASHFQAARDENLRKKYEEEAPTIAGTIRRVALPYSSPFDNALAFLAQWWPHGAQLTHLPTEGGLSPFTVRVYTDKVGIEPHQDILSAESPIDPRASQLAAQFAANIYLSVGEAGGAIEIFDVGQDKTDYKNLSGGPRVFRRDELPQPTVVITPKEGELILFSSRNVHAVIPNSGNIARVTVSFFVGIISENEPLLIWV